MKTLEQYRAEKLSENVGDPSLAVKRFVNDAARVRWEGMQSFLNKADLSMDGNKMEAVDHINDMINACMTLKKMLGQSS